MDPFRLAEVSAGGLLAQKARVEPRPPISLTCTPAAPIRRLATGRSSP
jgi:hypothetical protein